MFGFSTNKLNDRSKAMVKNVYTMALKIIRLIGILI